MVDELTEKIAQGSSDALKAQNEQIEKMAEKMQEVTDNMSKAAVLWWRRTFACNSRGNVCNERLN